MAPSSIPIFISYARRDKPHLRKLLDVLRPSIRQQQVQIWSRVDIPAGANEPAMAAQQLAEAKLVVVLLSVHYTADEQCYGEALQALAAQAASKSHTIAVRLSKVLLPEGDPLAAIAVLAPTQLQPVAQSADPDGAWVDIAGGILAAARAHAAKTPPLASVAPPLAPLDLVGDALFEHQLLHPLALGCNRREQWGALDALMNDTSRDDLILIPGELDQGHDFFLQRIGRHLRRDPSRQIISVWWDRAPFPLCKDEYYEQLAAALRCPVGGLRHQLQRILHHHNLVLLHRTVSDKFAGNSEQDRHSIALFREWLPELLQLAREGSARQAGTSGHAVKCVQPIAWRPVSALKQLLARVLALPLGRLPRELENWLHPQRARALLRALERTAGTLMVQRLVELSGFTDEDLRTVCRQAAIPSARWAQFIADARWLGPTPEKLLLCMSTLLRDPALKATHAHK